MALSSGARSAKKWADMDDESDSELGCFTSILPETSASSCGGCESDETCSFRTSDVAPLDCSSSGSDDEPVQEAVLEQPATELKSYVVLSTTPNKTQQPQFLATTPVKGPEPPVLDLCRSLFIKDNSQLNNDQSVAPMANFFHPRKLHSRSITSEELERSKIKPGGKGIEARMKPQSDPISGCVGIASLDECTNVCQDSWPQPTTTNEFLKQPKRANKPSKFRRDRYKALVEQLQQKMAADPTIEIASMLSSLPSWITSDEQLQGKLMARLQHHRQKQEQWSGCSVLTR